MSHKTHDDLYVNRESSPPTKRLITRRRVVIGGGAVVAAGALVGGGFLAFDRYRRFGRDAESRRGFERSGIMEAALEVGAEVVLPEESAYHTVMISPCLGTLDVLEPFVVATKIINVPIAKHHSLTSTPAGMKNWIGTTGKLRVMFRNDINRSIAEMAAPMRPTLTVVDASRVLMEAEPHGGSLSAVKQVGAVAVGGSFNPGPEVGCQHRYSDTAFVGWGPFPGEFRRLKNSGLPRFRHVLGPSARRTQRDKLRRDKRDGCGFLSDRPHPGQKSDARSGSKFRCHAPFSKMGRMNNSL